jgi:hypothetical protein
MVHGNAHIYYIHIYLEDLLHRGEGCENVKSNILSYCLIAFKQLYQNKQFVRTSNCRQFEFCFQL